MIRYEEYETNYDETMKKLLNFLDLEQTVGGREGEVKFEAGKNYKAFFYPKERESISNFIREVSSPETLELVSSYLTENSRRLK